MDDDFAFLGTETGREWAEWELDNAVVEENRVRIRQERLPAYVDPEQLVELSADEPEILAIDVDDCGDLYVLTAAGTIARYDSDREELRPFDCAGVEIADGRDLLVTPEIIFVADAVSDPDAADSASPDSEPSDSGSGAIRGRIVALSRDLRQTRWIVTDAHAVPVALADQDEVVYALFAAVESGSGGAGSGGGSGSGGGPGSGAGGGFLSIVDPDGSRHRVIEGLSAPRDVSFDAAGICYLLDETGSREIIRRVGSETFDPGTVLSAPGAWDVPVPTGAVCLAAGQETELIVGRHGVATGEATLHRVGPDGSEPLAGFTRGLIDLHLAGDLYALADTGLTVHRLASRTRYHRDEATGGYDARVIQSFDAGEPGVQWHRVTIGFEADEPGTQIRLSYAATDEPRDLDDVRWQDLDPANPHDALLESAEGQFLWLRIELRGDRFRSPAVGSVRAYFPRQSYLRHLPAIYQNDSDSRAFLERYLSLFESTYVGVEEDLGAATQYLDPDGIPREYLEWLEGWLAIDTDETWPAPARRELLNRAPDLFRKRGTPDGLLELVELYLEYVAEPSPAWEALIDRQLDAVEDRDHESPADARRLRRRINSSAFLLEFSDLDCVEGDAREAFTHLIECPQCFFVFVRPFVTDDEFEAVQSLVDDTRPAHAVGNAVQLEPSIVLGGHSYLGINSLLPERDLVVGTGKLGRDSVLDEREDAGQLEVRSALGEDITLS